MRQRAAPSVRRTAISRWRAVLRASTRLIRFAAAASNTSIMPRLSASRAGRMGWTRSSCRWRMRNCGTCTSSPSRNPGSAAAMYPAICVASLLAPSSVVPGASRAITSIDMERPRRRPGDGQRQRPAIHRSMSGSGKRTTPAATPTITCCVWSICRVVPMMSSRASRASRQNDSLMTTLGGASLAPSACTNRRPRRGATPSRSKNEVPTSAVMRCWAPRGVETGRSLLVYAVTASRVVACSINWPTAVSLRLPPDAGKTGVRDVAAGPCSGCASAIRTSRSALGYGRGCRSTLLVSENTAVDNPRLHVSVSSAIVVAPRAPHNDRQA